jgi:3-dehydroquinate dehydratase
MMMMMQCRSCRRLHVAAGFIPKPRRNHHNHENRVINSISSIGDIRDQHSTTGRRISRLVHHRRCLLQYSSAAASSSSSSSYLLFHRYYVLWMTRPYYCDTNRRFPFSLSQHYSSSSWLSLLERNYYKLSAPRLFYGARLHHQPAAPATNVQFLAVRHWSSDNKNQNHNDIEPTHVTKREKNDNTKVEADNGARAGFGFFSSVSSAANTAASRAATKLTLWGQETTRTVSAKATRAAQQAQEAVVQQAQRTATAAIDAVQQAARRGTTAVTNATRHATRAVTEATSKVATVATTKVSNVTSQASSAMAQTAVAALRKVTQQARQVVPNQQQQQEHASPSSSSTIIASSSSSSNARTDDISTTQQNPTTTRRPSDISAASVTSEEEYASSSSSSSSMESVHQAARQATRAVTDATQRVASAATQSVRQAAHAATATATNSITQATSPVTQAATDVVDQVTTTASLAASQAAHQASAVATGAGTRATRTAQDAARHVSSTAETSTRQIQAAVAQQAATASGWFSRLANDIGNKMRRLFATLVGSLTLVIRESCARATRSIRTSIHDVWIRSRQSFDSVARWFFAWSLLAIAVYGVATTLPAELLRRRDVERQRRLEQQQKQQQPQQIMKQSQDSSNNSVIKDDIAAGQHSTSLWEKIADYISALLAIAKEDNANVAKKETRDTLWDFTNEQDDSSPHDGFPDEESRSTEPKEESKNEGDYSRVD